MPHYTALLLIFVLLTTTLAKPDGFYRQEYQYKQSSSSYKNNELQHKNDNEGFYAKHGDLTGEREPIVDERHERREFINPKLRAQGLTAQDLHNGAMQSGAQQQLMEDFGVGYSGSAYNTHQGHRYVSTATDGASSGSTTLSAAMRSFLADLQYDMERTLERQLQQWRQDRAEYVRNTANAASTSSGLYSPSTSSVDAMRRELQHEIRTNVTRELDLRNRIAHYDGADVAAIKAQLQETLMRQLGELMAREQLAPTDYRTYSAVSALTTVPSARRHVNYSVAPPSHHEQDDLNEGRQRVTAAVSRNTPSYASSSTGGGLFSASAQRYDRVTGAPIVRNVNEITEIAQQVQNDMQQVLVKALDQYQREHTYSHLNTKPDYTYARRDFESQLHSNVSEQFRTALERHFGAQDLRGQYYYSRGGVAGATAADEQRYANYKRDDYERLWQQVQENLRRYLGDSLKTQQDYYDAQQRAAYTSSSSSQQYGGDSYAARPANLGEQSSRSYSASSSYSGSAAYRTELRPQRTGAAHYFPPPLPSSPLATSDATASYGKYHSGSQYASSASMTGQVGVGVGDDCDENNMQGDDPYAYISQLYGGHEKTPQATTTTTTTTTTPPVVNIAFYQQKPYGYGAALGKTSDFMGDLQKPVSSMDNYQQPVSKTDDLERPVSSMEDYQRPVSSMEDYQRPVSSMESYQRPISSMDNYQRPVSKTDDLERPVSFMESYQRPVSSMNNYQRPISKTDDLERPVSSMEDFQRPVSSMESYQRPVSSMEDYQRPVSSLEDFQRPVSSMGDYQRPVSSMEYYQRPVSSMDNYQRPVSSMESYQRPVSSMEGYQRPVSDADDFQRPVSSTEDFQRPVSEMDDFRKPVELMDTYRKPSGGYYDLVSSVSGPNRYGSSSQSTIDAHNRPISASSADYDDDIQNGVSPFGRVTASETPTGDSSPDGFGVTPMVTSDSDSQQVAQQPKYDSLQQQMAADGFVSSTASPNALRKFDGFFGATEETFSQQNEKLLNVIRAQTNDADDAVPCVPVYSVQNKLSEDKATSVYKSLGGGPVYVAPTKATSAETPKIVSYSCGDITNVHQSEGMAGYKANKPAIANKKPNGVEWAAKKYPEDERFLNAVLRMPKAVTDDEEDANEMEDYQQRPLIDTRPRVDIDSLTNNDAPVRLTHINRPKLTQQPSDELDNLQLPAIDDLLQRPIDDDDVELMQRPISEENDDFERHLVLHGRGLPRVYDSSVHLARNGVVHKVEVKPAYLSADYNVNVDESVANGTESPGFWRRVSGKISNTYNNAKQKARDMVEKINLL